MDKFRKVHGDGECYERPSEGVLVRYAGKLPEDLIEDWKECGWCSFAGGLFWTVNPDLYGSVLEEWLPEWCGDGSDTCVFARSAFGDLLISHQGSAGHLNVHYGRYIDMRGEVDIFLYTLKPDYLLKAMDGELAKKAMKKLGHLAPDEMFTFEPALALGGEPKLKYVRKVKLFPQLSFLAQLFDSVRIE